MPNQNTYNFPKVTPADPHELRETLKAVRREASDQGAERPRPEGHARRRAGDRRP